MRYVLGVFKNATIGLIFGAHVQRAQRLPNLDLALRAETKREILDSNHGCNVLLESFVDKGSVHLRVSRQVNRLGSRGINRANEILVNIFR